MILLIILASVGVAFGAFPLPVFYRSEESVKNKIELVETKEDETEFENLEEKN
ncbi:hypothetical protein BH23BAC1_BH23BAC1_15990 [soil metagenome]